MKNNMAGSLMIMWLALLCLLPAPAWAQTDAATEKAKLAAEEKEGCTRNLKIIYDAIQAYRIDHKDIPYWLSDLVPQYITDPNVLICPVCKRTGQVELPPYADPKLPCSYLFEFCPVPFGKRNPPNDFVKTHREWKRRQMGLVGSIVPMVRCRFHPSYLNLSFDGRIYDSYASWENMLTNWVNIAELRSTRINGSDSTPETAPNAASHLGLYPPRGSQARPGLIDLSAYYNASLAESWHSDWKNDLISLPTGVQNFAGVEYDVRGMVQLGSKASTTKSFPAQVNGIKIHQKCARLNFLHAAAFGSIANEGERVGSYIVHYAANRMQSEIPIIYGHDVCDWHAPAQENFSSDLTVAWTGTNETSVGTHTTVRLFTTTWVNLAPGVEIESVDFISAMGAVAPFLIAITAE
jgi:hypothetical protein